MATARAERLVNLVLCLLSTRQFLSADKIRTIVAGYADTPSEEAFFRMFERDKAELRDLGVPLEIGRNSAFDTVDGYRIARRDYELPDIELEPDEAAAVALAARLWDSPDLAGAARGALLKLRAAGVDVHDEDAPPVQPRVRAAGPAFATLLAAVQAGRAVTFDYRRHPADEPRRRHLEPWGVVSYRGRWYVVGHDRERDATRSFRLSRIIGEVSAIGPAGVVRSPEGVDLLALVTGAPGSVHEDHHDTAPSGPAVLWLAAGRAQGLRRRARVVGSRTVDGVAGDLVEIDLHWPETAARWIAGYGPDAMVVSPDWLRRMVVERLAAAAGHALVAAEPAS